MNRQITSYACGRVQAQLTPPGACHRHRPPASACKHSLPGRTQGGRSRNASNDAGVWRHAHALKHREPMNPGDARPRTGIPASRRTGPMAPAANTYSWLVPDKCSWRQRVQAQLTCPLTRRRRPFTRRRRRRKYQGADPLLVLTGVNVAVTDDHVPSQRVQAQLTCEWGIRGPPALIHQIEVGASRRSHSDEDAIGSCAYP